jgi:hypothetical protein
MGNKQGEMMKGNKGKEISIAPGDALSKIRDEINRNWFYMIWIIVSIGIMIYVVMHTGGYMQECNTWWHDQVVKHCQNTDEPSIFNYTWVINNGDKDKDTDTAGTRSPD